MTSSLYVHIPSSLTALAQIWCNVWKPFKFVFGMNCDNAHRFLFYITVITLHNFFNQITLPIYDLQDDFRTLSSFSHLNCTYIFFLAPDFWNFQVDIPINKISVHNKFLFSYFFFCRWNNVTNVMESKFERVVGYHRYPYKIWEYIQDNKI